ncbi:MAG: methyltransferase domain-containing protein [Methanobacteriaceae archaeon]|jgi:tRNA (guanine37-N1)-methyltransferase|nr:methyltransferase domain-containing protein [Candidatus Methanorudis spinitermitis]
MLAIKVPLKGINELRKILKEKEIINLNYKISSENRYGYIPINIKKEKIAEFPLKTIENELNEKLRSLKGINIKNYNDKIANSKKNAIQKQKIIKHKKNNTQNKKISIEIIEKDLKKLKKRPKSIREHLKGKLTLGEIEDLKKSFDIIGDLVILEIPENLEKYKAIIGEASLNFTKRKAIFMKKSAVKGIRRIREIEHIAGKKISQTIHKEHGIKLKLDLKDVYFSPRLATERLRVAKQVDSGEVILDMFAGIGPFPILIAKNKKVKIFAVDINESAIEYMKESIKLNKLKGEITPILGDINEIAKERFKKEGIKFDRIIMNLPGTSFEFLDLAISLIKNEGGIVHYYEFSDNYTEATLRIEKIANKYGMKSEVLASRKVKSRSPGMWHIVIDTKLVKKL